MQQVRSRVHSLNENAEKVEKQVDTCNIVLSVLRVVEVRSTLKFIYFYR